MAFRLVPVLILLALLKLIFSGVYLYYSRTGRLTLSPAVALATVEETPKPSCPDDLFRALRVEKEKISQREAELAKKEKDLALLEQEVKRRLASLSSLEDELDKKLKELRAIKSKRFKLLVGAYATMKPSKAAKLLVSMEPQMAIKILSALKTDQVARILSAMPPEKAASLAESLTGLPPREM